MPEESDSSRPAVFFDRDNTLIRVGAEYVGDPKDVVLMNGAAEAVAGARHMGFATVTISNQSGVARGFFTEKEVRAVNRRLDELLKERDRRAVMDRHEFCPHHPAYGVAPYRQACQCRKPRDGMLRRAATALKLDLGKSWLIGDAPRDIEAGHSAGTRTILLTPDDVEPSPAALGESRVAPDFHARNLREAMWIIARETGKKLPAMSAEESELDELQDITPQIEFDADDLSLADAHEDPVTAPPETRRSPRPPADLRAAVVPERLAEAPAAAPEAPSTVSPAAPGPAMRDEPVRSQEEGSPGALRVAAIVAQVGALALVGWASYPALDQSRLLLAIFAQLLAMTFFVASRE